MTKKILRLVCCLILASGCTMMNKPKDRSIELTPQQVLDKLQDAKENSFLLYITSENCYACNEYEKMITGLQQQQPFDIYYLKIDPSEKDKEQKRVIEELKITTGKYATVPMTYYFYQGNLLPENTKDGYIEEKDMRKWLQNLHIIK